MSQYFYEHILNLLKGFRSPPESPDLLRTAALLKLDEYEQFPQPLK